MFGEVLSNVKNQSPIVHTITNYVTVNDCANIILACGASPIMAEDINEVEEITSIANALVINMGTLNKNKGEAMVLACKKANELNHPIVLDPVGVGASKFRGEIGFRLLNEVNFSVIRGNMSEIKFLAKGIGYNNGFGVDVLEIDKVKEDNLLDAIEFAKDFSTKVSSVIAITGEIDIVTDGNKTYVIRNGCHMMSKVTGTGCMLTAIIGSFVGANHNNILEATATAVCAMGVCGELAHKKLVEIDGGTGTYRMLLIDYMSKFNESLLKEGANIESK